MLTFEQDDKCERTTWIRSDKLPHGKTLIGNILESSIDGQFVVMILGLNLLYDANRRFDSLQESCDAVTEALRWTGL